MRTILGIFVLLLCLTSLQGTVTQYTLPDYNRTVDYVTTLIQGYVAYVNSNYVHPEHIKEYLSLYSGEGDSFKVVVLQSEPNDPSCVALIFIPIHQNELNIVLDDNHTLADALGKQVYITCPTVFENVAFESGSTVIPVHLMLVISKTQISGNDYLTNANSTARSLAQEDMIMSGGPSPPSPDVYTVTVPEFVKILQTTTQTTTAPTTIVSFSNQTLIGINGQVFKIPTLGWIAVIGAVALWFLYEGTTRYFGGWEHFLEVLGDEKKRKESVETVTKVLRLLKRRKKTPDTEKQNHSEQN